MASWPVGSMVGGWHAEVDACEIEEGSVAVQDGEFDLGGLQLRGHGQWPSNIGSPVQRVGRSSLVCMFACSIYASTCHLHLIRSAAQDGAPRAAQLNAKKFCS